MPSPNTLFVFSIGYMEPQYYPADTLEEALLAALDDCGADVREIDKELYSCEDDYEYNLPSNDNDEWLPISHYPDHISEYRKV